MIASWKQLLPWLLAASLVVMAALAGGRSQPIQAADGLDANAVARYSVIDTEGHNLIVVDNQSNTLFFYTIDKDKAIGAELMLRGSIDLKQVGKASIKLKKAAQQD